MESCGSEVWAEAPAAARMYRVATASNQYNIELSFFTGIINIFI